MFCAGHILDDQDLVDTLQQSKGKNQEIYTRVQQSEETERKIDAARKKYLPVCWHFFVDERLKLSGFRNKPNFCKQLFFYIADFRSENS